MTESSILLVGMMAVGKTSVGRRLAELRGWEFFDSDRQVETMTGRTVAEIWRTDGEPEFRRLEAQVLADALASSTPRIIAAAGGTVLDARNRGLMQLHHPVVWLRADPDLLATRLGSATHRPLLDEDPAGVLKALDAIRRPLYEEVADVVIDVDDLTPDQVVTCIEVALEHPSDWQRDGDHGSDWQRDGDHGSDWQRDGDHGSDWQRDGDHGSDWQRDGDDA